MVRLYCHLHMNNLIECHRYVYQNLAGDKSTGVMISDAESNI